MPAVENEPARTSGHGLNLDPGRLWAHAAARGVHPLVGLLSITLVVLFGHIVEEMMEAIRTMKREGLGLVISEQNLAFARLVAERVYVIEKGVVRFSGTMSEFDARPEIRDAYLAP